MRILHVTPHLPPDQAANALLPWQLGTWAREQGDEVEYVAHDARAPGKVPMPGPVEWIPRRGSGRIDRLFRIGSIRSAWLIWRALVPLIARADVVHVHSNGLLAELAILLARRHGKPTVLTLYGTEIWHYEPKRRWPDLFTRAYRAATCVTFYSERLMARARDLGLERSDTRVVYPPVGPVFAWHDMESQRTEREALGIASRHLLLNVKRLHPLAGQRFLIEALSEIVREHPDTRLVICGSGPLGEELRRAASAFGVERHVVFAGLVDNATVARYCAAADLFVLPSLLEALPTVAVEALACGTPVVSSDNPGGLELNDLFGPDVEIVPKEHALALAGAISRFLGRKRRTLPGTGEAIEREFRPEAVAGQYRAVYDDIARRGTS